MRKAKEHYSLDRFIEQRIKENKKMFSKKELVVIKNNKSLIKKIYILAIRNIKDIINKL